MKGKRQKRGRPKKDEPPPEDIIRYRVEADWTFDEELAKRMAEDYNIRVIVTSLPRAKPEGGDDTKDTVNGDPFEGAMMRDVMSIYLGQWRVERIFGEY